jgi:hypothetical protein
LQPLGVLFMLPLSTYYSQKGKTWLRQNPERVVSVHQVAHLFVKVCRTACNAVNGFKSFGI